MHRRLVVVSIVAPLLVVAAAVVGGRWVSGEVAADTRSSLTSALDTLPSDTVIAGFTDWSQIRRQLDLGSATTASARAALTDDASLKDLSSRSVIGQYTEEIHDAYGWSAADLEWEAYGQAPDGAVMAARLDDGVSFASVRSRLTGLGYSEDDGVWTLSAPSPEISDDLASTLGSIALVPRERLIIAADRPAYVLTVLETVDRQALSLLSVRSASDVAAELVGADSALLQSGPFACEATSVADEEADVQDQARTAIQRAGGTVAPLFVGRALDGGSSTDRSSTDETMRFAFTFRSPTIAARQLQVRTALTTGPFIGRSGRVEDSLTLRSSGVRGSTAAMRFDHDPDTVAFMGGDGPLLFAGC